MGPRSRARWVAWLGLWLVLDAAAARADSVVMLPPRTEEIADASASAARTALAEALVMQGLSLLDFDATRERLGLPAGCPRGNCEQRMLDAEVVDVTATVTVGRDTTGEPARVFVTLTDRARELYEAESSVARGDVRAATTRALLEARALQLLGPGPWLRVNGTPDGAEVFIDDERVGTLPYRGRIARGAHRVRVQAEGYEAFDREVAVSESGPRKLDVDVTLRPGVLAAPNAGATTAGATDGDSEPAWQVFPIVMGAAGLALATVTTVRLASGLDSCVQADDAGRCTERRSVQVAPTVVYYSLSAALIGGAIAWLVIGSADDGELTAEVGVGAAGIRGSF